MSASTASIGHDAAPVAGPRDQRRRELLRVVSRHLLEDEREEAIPCRGSPPLAASRMRRLDPESRAWFDALDSEGLRRTVAIGRLHALLLREARFEVGRRTAALAHPSGRDLDDLALQAADDAVVAILDKLHQFRGDSLFTTWARRFVQREAPVKIRRRVGRNRELPMELELEASRMWHATDESPHGRTVAKEAVSRLAHLIAHELTAHQREVLIALAIDGVATEELARRLATSTGALYKTLHDARRKLKANLGTDLATSDAPA
jgi:RNA polymerase sigma-70 factor (ECF subfamily)